MDVLASLPLGFVSFNVWKHALLRLPRVLRVFRLPHYFDDWEQHTTSMNHILQLSKLFAGIVMIVLAPQIVALFSDEPEVIRYGTSCLRILGVGYPMYAVGMIITQALNGAGDTTTPSIMNFICFWVLQIPLAYWLATAAGFGPNGVFVALVIAESLLTVMGVAVFRTGKWRDQQV